MRNSDAIAPTSAENCLNVANADVRVLRETTTRQEQEIEHLKAEKQASQVENTGLREAARADQIQIEHLLASNSSLEHLVTELRAAQVQIDTLNRDLRNRNEALETLNKELESFSYAVSHDLRAPLRSIFGFSDALRRSASGKLSAQENAWLEKTSAAAVRMDTLIESLLRLSRITRAQLKREVVDVAEVARQVVRELRQTNPERDAAFAIPDSLPVNADPILIRVVITNLLENAWKYTGQVKQALISLGWEQDIGTPVLCVRDNGAGFDMAYASKLFTPFQRLHSAREFPGSGIGLACVARAIYKHGGRIWADAKTGQGAAFYFTLGEAPEFTKDGSPALRNEVM
jgi:light-regulated signal transduction histidine kinase (bacteriophytochrome)